MAAERWINVVFPSRFTSPGAVGPNYGLADQFVSDIGLLQYEGVRCAVPLWSSGDYYHSAMDNSYANSFSLLPDKITGPGQDIYENQTLLYNQVDQAAQNGLKLVIILAYGPDNVDTASGTWATLYGLAPWNLYTRPPAGTPLGDGTNLWDRMAYKFQRIIDLAVARWQSWGRLLSDLRFEWWNEPFFPYPSGAGGSLTGGVDAAFQNMSQRILPQLNFHGCRLYGSSFQLVDTSGNPSYPPLDPTASIIQLDQQLTRYSWPLLCTDWAIHLYPFPIARDSGGAAYFANLMLMGGMQMVAAIRAASFGRTLPIHVTEFGISGRQINLGAPTPSANYPAHVPVEGRAYDTELRAETLAAVEQSLLNGPFESVHLYQLGENAGEGTGMAFGLRSYNFGGYAYDKNYFNAYKRIAANIGVNLPAQPNGLPWPPVQAPPVNPSLAPIAALLNMYIDSTFSATLCKLSTGACATPGIGDPVGLWNSGLPSGGNFASQALAGSCPSLAVSNAINSIAAISNDGVSGFMDLNAAVTALGDFHIFVAGSFPHDGISLADKAGLSAVGQQSASTSKLYVTIPAAVTTTITSDAIPDMHAGQFGIAEFSRSLTNYFFGWNGGSSAAEHA